MNMTLAKEAINKSFSQQASTYAHHADVQIRSAQLLAQFIQKDIEKVPAGKILELGCGTGILTTHLLRLFTEEQIIASDASASMLEECEQALTPLSEKVQLALLDLDDCKNSPLARDKRYALIASSFSLQWVADFYATLENFLSLLKSDGQLVFAVPLDDSFGEWRQQCLRAKVPFTANHLPSKTVLIDWCRKKSLTIECCQQPLVCSYNSSLDFFRSLKGVGAAVNTSGQKLNATQLRRLIHSWDAACEAASVSQIHVTYQVLCARITRGYAK